MSFRLLIECSKELSSINIDFTDGTSISQFEKETSDRTELIDTTNDTINYSSEKVELPTILEIKREVNVASELQDLDI